LELINRYLGQDADGEQSEEREPEHHSGRASANSANLKKKSQAKLKWNKSTTGPKIQTSQTAFPFEFTNVHTLQAHVLEVEEVEVEVVEDEVEELLDVEDEEEAIFICGHETFACLSDL
jgi:hypothetical protein